MARPYEDLPFDKMILRDYLAVDRTILANERTFLAYTRTAFAIVVAGLSFLEFFGGSTFRVMGWICLPLGAAVFAVGIRRFHAMRVTRYLAECRPVMDGSREDDEGPI